MKQEKNVSRHIIINLWLIIVLVALILLIGLELSTIRPGVGYACCIAAILILCISIFHYEYTERLVLDTIQTAGIEQNLMQQKLFLEMPVPYVMTDDKGNIIWYNRCFADMVGSKGAKSLRKNINRIFPTLNKKVFPAQGSNKRLFIYSGERKYRVECSSLVMDVLNMNMGISSLNNLYQDAFDEEEISVLEETEPVKLSHTSQEEEDYRSENILAFLFFDVTVLASYEEEMKKKSLVVGLIYVDNCEEVMENMEEARKALLLAVIERKLAKYIQNFQGIIKKFEKDRFFFVMEAQNLEKMLETKFSILDEIRTLNYGNDLAITLSIGVGANGSGYMETYNSARIAMDLALGRGGDQAVVRDGDSNSYYGGKSQKVEKSTRVKARVKAHALREIMLSHDCIFIMGHKFPDADCVGAALGIYRLCKTFEKEAYIVMDKDFPGIEPIVSRLYNAKETGEDIFITSEMALLMREKNAALIIVDVNIPSRTESPELLKHSKSIVVLDHHRVGEETIKNAVLSYVEPYASSSCEMVAEILQYIADKPKLKNIEADALYSGILVDTDNFVVRAGVRTFEAAAYLRRMGADVTRVRKMFRDDMTHKKICAEVIARAETYMDEFAISVLDVEGLSGASIVGAKAANNLLDVQGIRASFVLTNTDGAIFISARSIDDINVQVIMEQFGGGGHLTVAAAQLRDCSLSEAVDRLKAALRTMKENKDI